jgi:hypothetical protein
MVTELHVADLNVSLAFWTDIIGFEIAYSDDVIKDRRRRKAAGNRAAAAVTLRLWPTASSAIVSRSG